MSPRSNEARMLTKSLRGSLGMVLAVFVTVVILSEWTMAQQTGLFPLAPIKRQRVPCSQEDPVYKLYKDQYFGYHPTLWRRFPSGWGAPSPEAPDAKAEFAKLPLQPPEDFDQGDEGEEGADQGQGPDMGGPPPRGPKPELPVPPGEEDRSPFELERPNGAGPAPNRDEPPVPPRGNQPKAEDTSPFEKLNPRASVPTAPRASDPELAPPAAPRTTRRGRASEIDASEAGSPILSMSDSVIRVSDRGAGLEDMSDGLDVPTANPRPASAQPTAPHQHTPRRSRIATLMDGMGWSAVRR